MMDDVVEQSYYQLVCAENTTLCYQAPLKKLPNGRPFVYFDCSGELALVQKMAQQQQAELESRLETDRKHTAIMYFGSGSTYGQAVGEMLGLAVAIVGWGEVKPKWRDKAISSMPFKSIMDTDNALLRRVIIGWPQLEKFNQHQIERLIIADDVLATGESLLATENLVEKIAAQLQRNIFVEGFVTAAQVGGINSSLQARLLAKPVFHIPLIPS
jgi:hypothetical protein